MCGMCPSPENRRGRADRQGATGCRRERGWRVRCPPSRLGAAAREAGVGPEERRKYYADYRRQFPPAGEHEDGFDYAKGHRVYNWATPMESEQPSEV